jgi:hypothetical protein
MRLFHFSDDPNIEVFTPRPVNVPSTRPPGKEWLNGPLVWAIDDQHQPMYLFPRQCPRILIWRTNVTTPEDVAKYWNGCSNRMIAFIERRWFEPLSTEVLYRYEFSVEGFEALDDSGMWVSRSSVRPVARKRIADLTRALRDSDVDLRLLDSLLPLKGVWSSSVHASGIRLRNAVGWAVQ